ncbi:hypothetical protein HanRHA438_Chr08g0370091 [Helianthus annuus]|nr:hypothetical protein HanRHA438_Chr08g0370091 [Helianthus annuus]
MSWVLGSSVSYDIRVKPNKFFGLWSGLPSIINVCQTQIVTRVRVLDKICV